MRVGTCGGLQPHHALGDLIVALTAVPADATASHLVDDEPHCPTASWELIHGAVHAAKELGQPMHVGPIVSSDVFYNPNEGQYERWSSRGVLGVEMEAAALFTVAAIGGIGKVAGVHGGCLLTVSDIIVEGVFTRITDEELRAAVDRMTRVALMTVTADIAPPLPRQPGVRERRDREALAGAPATSRRARAQRRGGAVGVPGAPRAERPPRRADRSSS